MSSGKPGWPKWRTPPRASARPWSGPAQKQASAQALAARTGELEQRLSAILQTEAALLALKERITAS